MKKTVFLTFVAVTLAVSMAWSQGATLTVFSAKGEKFTLEVNGSNQNAKPEARVFADNLAGPMIKVKVFLEETAIPPVTKTIMNKPNGTFIYVLQKDAKGKYVLQSSPTDWSDKVTPGVATETKKEVKEEAKTEEKAEKKEMTREEGAASGKTARCTDPMPEGEFYSSIGPMSHQPFDGPRLNSAKNLAQKHCLTSFQVRETIHIFDYEKSRLEFAKYAYDLVYDPDNYEEVYDALNTSSVNELKRYIEAKSK